MGDGRHKFVLCTPRIISPGSLILHLVYSFISQLYSYNNVPSWRWFSVRNYTHSYVFSLSSVHVCDFRHKILLSRDSLLMSQRVRASEDLSKTGSLVPENCLIRLFHNFLGSQCHPLPSKGGKSRVQLPYASLCQDTPHLLLSAKEASPQDEFALEPSVRLPYWLSS